MPNNLLFVTYTFPPFHTPESLLITRTVKALDGLGWRITVLTASDRICADLRDPSLLQQIPEPVEVVHVGGGAGWLVRPKPVRKALSFVLSRLGMPEMYLMWRRPAVRAGVALAQSNRFDVMHSWASYHTSNVVGLDIHRATGIPWVAHFSDPWVDNPYANYSPRQRRRARRLEEAVVREADALVFTTAQTVDLVMGKYPGAWREKAHVIPHGYDPAMTEGLLSEATQRRRLRLVYTGAFYKARNPSALFQALAKLDQPEKLEVVLIGPNVPRYAEEAAAHDLRDVVICRPPIPFVESVRLAAEAGALLLIDAPAAVSVFLPSKLVDYLALGKPILGITPPEGASADLLRRAGCPVVAPDDVNGIAAALHNLVARWEAGTLEPPAPEVVQQYDIRETTQALDALLRRVMT